MRGEDADLPINHATVRACPRKLKPGWVKRYMFDGPLVSYYIACPSCGFVDTWPDLDNESGFYESGGKLVAARRAHRCIICGRTIRIAEGRIRARRE